MSSFPSFVPSPHLNAGFYHSLYDVPQCLPLVHIILKNKQTDTNLKFMHSVEHVVKKNIVVGVQ